jgi:MEMO1 family protein
MQEERADIRKPAVAGLFYPSHPVELTKTIASLYASVDKIPLKGHPIAIIAPHAGYPYSGKVAAKAFKILEGEQIDTVVVISPSHTVFFRGCAVYSGDGYQTPLGIVEIDKELSQRIANIHPLVHFAATGHASGGARGEHGLEVQLPFLQIALGKFKLVAIVMGDQEEATVRALTETLATALRDVNAIMVASSDLSHFHPEKEARALDATIQSAVQKYDGELLLKTLESGKGEACGGGVMAAVLLATKRLGGQTANFVDYATSGETTGDFEEVVGYLSATILSGDKPSRMTRVMGSKAARNSDALSPEDKALLKDIARKAIEAKFAGTTYTPPVKESLELPRGAFVTLKNNDRLRGCIGQVKSTESLSSVVAAMALAAAFDDPRFPPVVAGEMPKLEIEISVLSRLERVHDLRTIVIGTHGLMIRLEMHSGLLLPQVAVENEWDVPEFLEQVGLKAGLPKGSFRDRNAEVYRFTADVF